MKAATSLHVAKTNDETFQSTPPVKAATTIICSDVNSSVISIHAAREGGDLMTASSAARESHISIHAAREGGDYYDYAFATDHPISIHAAREGGDA